MPESAVLILLGAPLAGALLLWILPRRPILWTGLALITVGALVVGLGMAGWLLVGEPDGRLWLPLGEGIVDPAVAETAWTLAPMVLSLVFLGIGLQARSWLLSGLAAVQVLLVLPAVLRDLGEPVASGVTEMGLVLDPLALTLVAVSVLVGGIIVVFATGYEPIHLHHTEQDPRRTSRFLGWLLVFLAAMHLLVLADDLRMLAVGWELTTLCSFALIGFDKTDDARVAARRALAYNLFGGSALAVALWLAGSHATVSGLLEEPGAVALTAILALLVLAAATKSALAPFHPWLLGAMVAAAPVSALLHASTMVKAGSYLLLRLSPAFADAALGVVVTAIGAFSVAGAALLALRERDLKRVLALSTVASLGMIAAAAGLGSPLALAAGILFLVLHAAAKGLAFLVVGSTEQVTGTRDLEALVGLGRARPSLAAPLLLAAAAMALPPFGIAVAKWALLLEGGTEPMILPVLAVGAAANVALWTAVAGRILVRRPVPAGAGDAMRWSQRTAVGVLTAATGAGLILAGPLAAAVADPAAEVAFGQAAPLALGWQVTALGGVFPVLAVAAALTITVLVAFLVAWRLPTSPEPYLSGVNVGAGSAMTFHGAGGESHTAASGGFYWGGAMGDASHPGRLRQVVELGGWLGVAAAGAVCLFGLAGVL